jgi:hypothetical protein
MATGFINLPVVSASTFTTLKTSVDYSNTGDNANTTTCTQLIFPALANTTYLLEYFLRVTSVAQAVIRAKPSYPTGTLLVYAGSSGTQGSGNAQTSNPPANGTQNSQYITTQAGDFSIWDYTIVIDVGSTAGDVTFAFSGANNADPTLIKAGSFVRVSAIS